MEAKKEDNWGLPLSDRVDPGPAVKRAGVTTLMGVVDLPSRDGQRLSQERPTGGLLVFVQPSLQNPEPRDMDSSC